MKYDLRSRPRVDARGKGRRLPVPEPSGLKIDFKLRNCVTNGASSSIDGMPGRLQRRHISQRFGIPHITVIQLKVKTKIKDHFRFHFNATRYAP